MSTKKVIRYYPHQKLRSFWRIVFITLILGLIYLHSFSQTQDGYLQVQFMGQTNGTYKVQVNNLQECRADIQWQFKGTASNISPDWKNNINHNEIAALSTCVFTITGTLTQISVKALSICNWAGQAPVWLLLDNKALPVTIKNIRITVIKN